MRIAVFNIKGILKYFPLLVLIILLVFFINITGFKALNVFTHAKELPIYCVQTDKKQASITFDCAWGADDIPDILQALKNENIKASFFIVGQWAEKYPDIVRMISLDGHDIANHSYSHLRLGEMDRGRINSEIQLCGNKLAELAGGKIELFRPPYGDYNNSVVETARELGYYTIQWDVDSLDWKPGISREEILTRICNKIKPGSIILFHNDTAHTAKMLPDIISALKNMKYELLPVSQLIMRNNYIIDSEGRQKKLD